MPECTCEGGQEGTPETLQGLEGLSVTETFAGATVLITGATGYIGSLVSTVLLVEGHTFPILEGQFVSPALCDMDKGLPLARRSLPQAFSGNARVSSRSLWQ